jgi:hypothetical protein
MSTMDRKDLYTPPPPPSSPIPDLRSGPRTQRIKVQPPPPKSTFEKIAISVVSGCIMALCVTLSNRVFGQMWIGESFVGIDFAFIGVALTNEV